MKKGISWLLMLSLCLALLCVPAMAEGAYTPGTYTGVSSGHENGLSVTVTVDENSITEVTVDVSNETAMIGGLAGEELAAQILAAQGPEIDGVSGATETSSGAKRALADALAQAQGGAAEAEKTPVADGSFKGTAPGFGLTGQMTCEVSFENGVMTDIQVVEETDSLTGEWFASAEELLIPRLLAEQSL